MTATIYKIIAILVFLTAWPGVTWAYIDPGTGSILIQGLIAAFAAVGVTLKLYWHRIIAFFKRRQRPKEPVLSDKDDTAQP